MIALGVREKSIIAQTKSQYYVQDRMYFRLTRLDESKTALDLCIHYLMNRRICYFTWIGAVMGAISIVLAARWRQPAKFVKSTYLKITKT